MAVAAGKPGDGLLVLHRFATGAPLEPEILRIALGEPASYASPRRCTRQVYFKHQPGVLRKPSVRWPGIEPAWISANGVWPDIEPGAVEIGNEPTLLAALVLRNRGTELVRLTDSDDRSVTFVIDASTPVELDELEQRVQAAISMETE